MRTATCIAICFILSFSNMNAYAWGPKGHDIVASIAERHLTGKARRELDKLLHGKSIVYFSSWMDNLRNSPDWENGYDRTKTWHYANVDKGHTYLTMPKNEKGDVITGLTMLTDALTSRSHELTDSVKADYVRMIVHMVGDLHCPMHAGRLTDRGGNSVKVKWFGSSTNLHTVWDSKLIDSARRWSCSEWADQLDRTDRKYRKRVMRGTFEEWFARTADCESETYDYIERHGDVPKLSYQFVYDFSPMLEEQLLTAGYRLAYVLNTIFG